MSNTGNAEIVTKTCSKCGDTLPIQYFRKDSTRKDGYRGVCKTCNNSYPIMREGFVEQGYVDPRTETGVTKKCPDCGETKDTAYFGKDKQRVDGLTYYCLKCKRRRWREYAANKARKIKGDS